MASNLLSKCFGSEEGSSLGLEKSEGPNLYLVIVLHVWDSLGVSVFLISLNY